MTVRPGEFTVTTEIVLIPHREGMTWVVLNLLAASPLDDLVLIPHREGMTYAFHPAFSDSALTLCFNPS